MKTINEEDRSIISIALFNSLPFFKHKFRDYNHTDFQLEEIYHRLRGIGSRNTSSYRVELKEEQEKRVNSITNTEKITLQDFQSQEFKDKLKELVISIIKDIDTYSTSLVRKTLNSVHNINVDYDTVYFLVVQYKNKKNK